MPDKTLIIFDVDGTLVYSNKLDSQCFAATYEQIYGKTFLGIDWTKYTHVTDTVIFRTAIRLHFNRNETAGEIQFFQQQYLLRLREERTNRPGEFLQVPFASQALGQLVEDERFVVGIGTGGWQKPAELKLAHAGFQTHRLPLSAADGKETREDILNDAIQKATAKHRIGRVVYIGDAVWDVETTRKMALNFVGIRRQGDLEVLKKAGAAHVLTDYGDYAGFVETVFAAVPPLPL